MKSKKDMAIAATMALLTLQAPVALPFTDLPMNHWAYKAIEELSKHHLLIGRSKSFFAGDQELSRYELAQAAARLMIALESADLSVSQENLLEKLNEEFIGELDQIHKYYEQIEGLVLDHLKEFQKGSNKPMKIHGENRLRHEWRSEGQVNSHLHREDELTWMRTRLNLSKELKRAQVLVELQHNSSFGNGANANGALEDDPLNLHQAFGRLKLKNQEHSFLKIGRFEMSYGDETLIGADDWSQVGRTFDGLHYTLQKPNEKFSLEAFYTNLSDDTGGVAMVGDVTNPANPDPTVTDNQFMGLNLNWERILRGEFNLFYFKRNEDQADASDELNTTGFNWTRAKNNWSYYFQYAIQSGQTPMEGVDYGGQMQRITVSHELNHNVAAAIDYQNYTGDKSSTLDTFESWQSLYPTLHNILGYAHRINQEGPAFNQAGEPTPNTNIGVEDLSCHLSWKPARKSATKLAYHRFRAHHLGANISPNLGSEVDLLYSYQWSEDVAFELGLALYRAGNQPNDSLPGVSGNNAKFGWLSTKAQF